MFIYRVLFVDLNQNSTGFSGEFPEEPFGYSEFISALGDISYNDTIFKLKGAVSLSETINFDNFFSLEQWIIGSPWRIKADEVVISDNKKIKGGVLYANIGATTGDFTCGDNVNFYSSYIICKNFKFSDPSDSIRTCFLNGCTVKISSLLNFNNSKIISFNSIFSIYEVFIDTINLEEIIFRNSVVNLNIPDFSTAFKERSDNNTNQFGWVVLFSFPVWDSCVEEDFNFLNVGINSSGDPYVDYELGLFGSERKDYISGEYQFLGLGSTGAIKTVPYIDFYASTYSGSYPLVVKFTPVIKVALRVSKYTWYFGDGIKSNEISPTHTYQHGGDFSPILEVMFIDDKKYKEFKKDFISVFKIKINLSENTGNAPLNLKFYTEPSLPHGVSIESYDWDFGDSSLHSTEENPVHTYSSVNSYQASLTNTFIKDNTDI